MPLASSSLQGYTEVCPYEWLRVLRVLQNLEKSKTAICNPLIIKLCFWKFLPKTEFCNTANNMDTSKCVSP